MIEAVILLGGNVGDVPKRFEGVRAAIEASVGEILLASSVMRSAAWGFDSQEFYNQAVLVKTSLEPLALLDTVQALEQHWGRDRQAELKEKTQSGVRYTARAIDIDIIFYGDEIIEQERLTIPHPLIAEREFALEPIAQIAPLLQHPKLGKSVEQMLNELKS